MSIQAEFQKMPIEERIQLLNDLWDDIVDSSESIPVPDWHLDILKQRDLEFRKHPGKGTSWEEVQVKVRDLF